MKIIQNYAEKIIIKDNLINRKPNLSKKSRLTNSAFIYFGAKFVLFLNKYSKIKILCCFSTKSNKSKAFKTAIKFLLQNFFDLLCKKSVIKIFNVHFYLYISVSWAFPPIRYP